MSITIKAPAKINIFLDIIGKLENGYHSLFMVMQSVSLFDIITLEKSECGIKLEFDKEGIPCDERNTEYKAAAYFYEYTGITPGIIIKTEKHIPHGAGLGGGSSDAAAVLKGMNELYGTNLTESELREIGIKVGSDVPFCVVGGTCLAQNTGGVLSPLKPLKDCFIVLAKPDRFVSTAEAYALADSGHIYHPDCLKMLDCCDKGDFEGICRYAGNVFEQFIEVPERVEFKKIMRSCNASLTQMSGSGPTVFGIFEKESDASEAAEKLGKICNEVFLTEPVR